MEVLHTKVLNRLWGAIEGCEERERVAQRKVNMIAVYSIDWWKEGVGRPETWNRAEQV